jgi:hypothetical protein
LQIMCAPSPLMPGTHIVSQLRWIPFVLVGGFALTEIGARHSCFGGFTCEDGEGLEIGGDGGG